ncbi:hypothetical protein SH661x_001088 [Planctomicrobium sp. SH661]|uniref:hypothetical protein n=1 Tax=Planctomicrobium sp. SH661 TaxID=3448124 RepID=UPI003F5B1A97
MLPLLAIGMIFLLRKINRSAIKDHLEPDGFILIERNVSTGPDGLRMTCSKFDQLIYWPTFVSATLTDRLLLLFVERNVAVIFSRTHCNPQDFAAFISSVRMYAPQLADDLRH